MGGCQGLRRDKGGREVDVSVKDDTRAPCDGLCVPCLPQCQFPSGDAAVEF